MAIDETLLNTGMRGIATLRFYQWSAPTVSLGHFQAAQGQFVPDRFQGLEVVRRLSGGGAILHHRELTYSCVLPVWHPITKDPGCLYDQIHDAIVEVLQQFHVTCAPRGDAAFPDTPFLCFARGDERDLVCGSHKIVGSAQRRRQGTILQHGSILLKQSEWASEFPGIEELTGQNILPEELIPPLIQAIASRLDLVPQSGELSAEEHSGIESLVEQTALVPRTGSQSFPFEVRS